MVIWDNLRDCSAQLGSTIVRKGLYPVYVRDVGERRGDLYVSYRTLATGREGECLVSELDVSPVPLGYINFRGRAIYATRLPARRWKTGLDEGNIRGKLRGGEAVRLNPFSQGRSVSACIMGKYPSLAEAVAQAKEEDIEVAFSRRFALSPTGRTGKDAVLYYKAMEAGVVVNGVPTLKANFSFLNESLQKAIL